MVVLGYCEHKAKKGLIRVSLVTDEHKKKILGIRISGDFFLYPEEALWDIEQALMNQWIDSAYDVVKRIFNEKRVTLAGSSIDDFVNTIICAIENVKGVNRGEKT